MIFVIPSIYFLIRFFQIPKQKLADKETRLTLQCFAMAFSLTLAIHFYGTMIAGLCCIGIACGFCFRFLRKEYFRRIMFTGICSVFLAVLPMGIAFATGTPLQGSLGWGLSVINGGKSSSSTETEAETDEAETLEVSTGDDKNTVRVVKPDGTVMEIDVSDLPSAQENESGGQTQTETTAPAVPKVSFGEKIRKIPGKAKNALSEMSSRILEFIIKLDVKNIGYMILASFALPAARIWSNADVHGILYVDRDHFAVCRRIWTAAVDGWSKMQYLLCLSAQCGSYGTGRRTAVYGAAVAETAAGKECCVAGCYGSGSDGNVPESYDQTVRFLQRFCDEWSDHLPEQYYP